MIAPITNITSGKDALIREIRENEVTVLLGETGSGKTTREYPIHTYQYYLT
jgi:HrpA-like RNA helicase